MAKLGQLPATTTPDLLVSLPDVTHSAAKKKSSADCIERLEREANDELRLLAELGPSEFGYEHLLELRARLRAELTLFGRRQRLAMILGATAAGWVFLAIMLHFFGLVWLALTAAVAAGSAMTGFLALIFWQKKRFESRGELEHALYDIEAELRRRAQHLPRGI